MKVYMARLSAFGTRLLSCFLSSSTSTQITIILYSGDANWEMGNDWLARLHYYCRDTTTASSFPLASILSLEFNEVCATLKTCYAWWPLLWGADAAELKRKSAMIRGTAEIPKKLQHSSLTLMLVDELLVSLSIHVMNSYFVDLSASMS